MKITSLWIDNYKNLRNCELALAPDKLLNAVIGSNGSGKSNLIEAILHILIGVYFGKSPPFWFRLEYDAQRRHVELRNDQGDLSAKVDGRPVAMRQFKARLRDGPAQVFYPELTLVYYSGECKRVRRLVRHYEQHFERLTQKPDHDRHRPLFVFSNNQQANVILLALIAHQHQDFLAQIGVRTAVNVTLVLVSPEGFDSDRHEPKLWGTQGAVRRILAAIDDTAYARGVDREEKPSSNDAGIGFTGYTETRTYVFRNEAAAPNGIGMLARRLQTAGDNLYIALEHLKHRGMLQSVSYQLEGTAGTARFEFDHLSEGQKQLLAVVGALRLTNQTDNLILLDEPDTHLNPQWSWQYSSFLNDALRPEHQRASTVLMATHDPIIISGLTREQVFLAQTTGDAPTTIKHPDRNPRGQGIANLLCSSEFFGLPSSLDQETQKLLDERLKLSVKATLTDADKTQLRRLNEQLEIITPGVSERDPNYVRFLRRKRPT